NGARVGRLGKLVGGCVHGLDLRGGSAFAAARGKGASPFATRCRHWPARAQTDLGGEARTHRIQLAAQPRRSRGIALCKAVFRGSLRLPATLICPVLSRVTAPVQTR